MALSGEGYHYYVYGDGNRTKIRVEIDKTLSAEDFKYWRERIIDFLNNLEFGEA